ncbi:ABC transporter substrate-binding protein [Marinospirillum alkaliphilum]|uniref:Branched-chain amino acid transport system substrate-binding protein n=1 Tax=Marinospirillum alkaliphilum DSM 21637 TaxID=1122209 RepID=A0A1K1ZG17_9GAMM|nr:ABC transporter substrate-binding protein [Marinospirillum alkaliphilum]SFX72644.1 branched-chain amino acid transport system substrate-binding protein [Marinospirillum alkaliphilum DSM 21637]
MMKKTLLGMTLAAASVMGAAALQADVKIGFLGGFTGPIESMTPAIHAGAQLAQSHINAQGGLLNGRQFVMPTGDTTCADASAASNAADRMVNTERVTAIVGALCTGATIASANNAAIPAGVVMISPASTAPAVTTLNDNDLVFRTVPSDAFQGQALAHLLISKGIKEVVGTYVNNDYGRGLADQFRRTYTALGGEAVEIVAHEDNRADYRSELGALSAHGVDTLIIFAYADSSGQTVLRQAHESGAFSRYVGVDGMASENLVRAVGARVVEGMIATRPGSPKLPGADIFAAEARKAGFDPSAVFSAQAYDAAFILALAVEKNGSDARQGLSQAVRAVSSAPGEVILPGEWEKAKRLIAAGKDINYEGAAGSHEFDANGDIQGVVVEIAFENGRLVTKGEVKF